MSNQNSKSGVLYTKVSLIDLCDIAHRLGRYEQLGGHEGLKDFYYFCRSLSSDIGKPIILNVSDLSFSVIE